MDNNQDAEHLLWTVLDVVPKPGIQEAGLFGDPNETYKTLLLRLLNEQLKKHGKTVIEPDETEFVSQVAQALRKGQKAMHIKAFRGNKDGKRVLAFLDGAFIFTFLLRRLRIIHLIELVTDSMFPLALNKTI